MISSDWPVLRGPALSRPTSAVKRQAEALQAAGLRVEIFAFHGGRNPYNYAAAWTQLRPRLHRGRYDVVHAQLAENVWLAFPKRVPLVVTFRSGDLERRRGLGRFLELAARLMARRADAVIVGSEELRGRLPRRAAVHVIPPELDEQALTERLLRVYRSVLSDDLSDRRAGG